MGIHTKITVSCDYAGCKQSVSWNKEDVESGKAASPAEAAYLVILNHGGRALSFCGQYHAALFFMPPGYDVTKKKVVVAPITVVEHKSEDSPDNGLCECGHPIENHNNWGCCVTLSDKIGDFCKCDNPGNSYGGTD